MRTVEPIMTHIQMASIENILLVALTLCFISIGITVNDGRERVSEHAKMCRLLRRNLVIICDNVL